MTSYCILLRLKITVGKDVDQLLLHDYLKVRKRIANQMKLLVAAPRGFCAGVDRAIEIVEECLKKFGKPVYVRHEIVHNKYVVNELKEKGAIFVEELEECPEDRPVVFSAHGVAKSVFKKAKERNIHYIDATCPLVTKVHIEARRFYNLGYQVVMIGHRHHPETVGTMGQLPSGEVLLVETIDDVFKIKPKDKEKLASITQTTLSIDDTSEIAFALKKRFPNIIAPHKEDICYATTNRQNAVKKISPLIDGLLVVGSANSSNSKRLVEVGRNAGCEYTQLIDSAKDIDWRAISGSKAIGLTAGASAPDILINTVIDQFKKKFKAKIEFFEAIKEDVHFKLPRDIRNK